MGAPGSRVQRHLIRGHQIDGFDYVYLAVVGPEGPFGPECGPDRTSVWEVDYGDDPKTANIVSLLSRYPYRVSLLVEGDIVRIVDFDYCVTSVVYICEALLEGVISIEPPNIAKCEIIPATVEVPLIKESTSRVIVNKIVCRCSSSEKNERKEEHGKTKIGAPISLNKK
jgi:hypothetical protein